MLAIAERAAPGVWAAEIFVGHGVIADQMTASDDVLENLARTSWLGFAPREPPAHHKKCASNVKAVEDIENGGRGLGAWSVVERERTPGPFFQCR